MNIETRFNFGDRVATISQQTEFVTRPCAVCVGAGVLPLLNGGSVPCTSRYSSKDRCDDGHVKVAVIHPWRVGRSGTVGCIRFDLYDPTHPFRDDRADERHYMLEETGIGSGSLWKEDRLFASTEEAQTECDLRNALAASPATSAVESSLSSTLEQK